MKIAIAGGSGNVAQELIDFLAAEQKHEILLLSRKDNPSNDDNNNVTWAKVNYDDQDQLVQSLQGVNTLLCFFTSHTDPGNASQKNLIDAAVKAGVKRYAPSEWASSSFEYLPWYAGKTEIRDYLSQLNKDKKILEYCLFQPGIFTNYFASPHRTAKHIQTFQSHYDFNTRRAIVLDGGDDARLSLITVKDFCSVVAKAIDYEGEWPVVGGIQGDELTVGELIGLGEKLRGPFSREKLQADDLKAGVVKSSWKPKVEHPSLRAEQSEAMAGALVTGMLLGTDSGVWSVSTEWNKLLPDYKFTKAEDFLTEVWSGKP